MGNCNNCGKQIKIADHEHKCPYCGKDPYFCWNCHCKIDISKTPCSICGYFICDRCQKCGPDCLISTFVNIIDRNTSSKAARLIWEYKIGLIQKECEDKVPISYAHNKLRDIVLKLKGANVTNDDDHNAFVQTFNKISELPIGKTFTISQQKQHGTHGIETRELANLGICMGILKKKVIIPSDKNRQPYEVYERIDGAKCQYQGWDNVIVQKYCKHCKKTFAQDVEYCPTCTYKNGENKGQQRKLKIRKSGVHFCQLERLRFNKKSKVIDNGEDKGKDS